MKKFKYILFSLLFLAIFIPSFTLAEEQEHLTHTYTISGLSDSYEFEYYSEDANHPINFSSWQSGSTKYTGFKTDDGSYGFFTAYYNNSDVISQFSNVLIYNGSSASLPTYINYTDCRLIKIVFTPFRDTLEVGQLTEYNEFVGYTDITGYTKSSISDVYKSMVNDNFGQFDDYFHISSNILLYYSSEDRPFTFMYAYNWSNASFSDALVRFNPSNQSFCQGSTTNCIYPNLQSGLAYNFEASYRASTGEITFSVNGETLSFTNTSLKLQPYPLFAFYSTNFSRSSEGKIYYSRSALLRDLTIDNGEGKYITFYPAIYRTAENTYKTTVSFISSDGQDPSTYFSSHSYIKPTYYHSSEIFGNLFWYYDKPSSGGSSGSGGSGSGSSGDFYKRIYPPQNVTPIADWVSRIRSTYERLGREHYALYMTRYNKELDSLMGYYLLFDPKDASNYGKITYALNSDNTLSVTLSDDIYTNFSLTTIFDHSLTENYTPVENGAVGDDLLNYKNWNTYNTIYLDPNEIGFWSALIGSTDWINIGSNLFSNKQYTYLDLEISKTITFSPIVTNTNDIYFHPLVFYTSTSETDKYLDYYVVLNLSDGVNSNVKDIYNSSCYKDNETGEDVLSYYSVMPYLNLSFSFTGKDNETSIITSPSNDFDYSDTFYGKYGEEIKEAIKSEDEMKALNPLQILSENLSTLTDLLLGITDDVSSIFYQINDNSSYYYTYLESLSDTNLISTGNFMSNELQWIYDNTPFNVPINIGLCTSLVMAVIF